MNTPHINEEFKETITRLYHNRMPLDQIACCFKLTKEEVVEIVEAKYTIPRPKDDE
jgi:hypothetical protein